MRRRARSREKLERRRSRTRSREGRRPATRSRPRPRSSAGAFDAAPSTSAPSTCGRGSTAARAGPASPATRSPPPRSASPTPRASRAVSMRRIAAELDAGTMTLYHYVRTKDELLTLVIDAVMGEVVVPADEPMPDRLARRADVDRRAHAATRCSGTRGSSTSPTIPPIGPNSVRHFDQSLQAVASLPITLGRQARHRDSRSTSTSSATACIERNNLTRRPTAPFDAGDGRLRQRARRRPATTRSSRRSPPSTGSNARWATIESTPARPRPLRPQPRPPARRHRGEPRPHPSPTTNRRDDSAVGGASRR